MYLHTRARLWGDGVVQAGMVYTSQVERLLNYPVLNLGFSGHGLMQQEVGAVLARLDPALYVLDCEWNMDQYVSPPPSPCFP